MKNLTDVIKMYLSREYHIESLDITGYQLMEDLNLTYDDLYDFASEFFYPLDAFSLDISTKVASKIKTKLLIDESMWFKNDTTEDPIHSENGLKMIFPDCKRALCSSGLTLQKEGYAFKDLFDLMNSFSENEEIIITIPYIIEDFYKIIIKDGKVKKDKIDLSKISLKEARLGLFQIIMLAAGHTLEETLQLID